MTIEDSQRLDEVYRFIETQRAFNNTFDERLTAVEQQVKAAIDQRLLTAENLLVTGLIAMEHTREYVGYEMLPAIDGWSWYDWTKKVHDFLRSSQ